MPAPTTAELLKIALDAIPHAHREAPFVGEYVPGGYVEESSRFQDYAFWHMGYLKSAEIVKDAGYKPLESQEFWNLDKEIKKKRELTSQEEYAKIEKILTDAEGWHSANPQFAAEEGEEEVQNLLFTPLDGADSDEEGNALEEAELQAAARPSATRAATAREKEEEAGRRHIVLQLYWVQSSDPDMLQKNRSELLKRLRTKEQVYLRQTYQRKEYQFVRAYTKKLPNLGCHSTQRGEKNHHVTKEKGLNRHLRLVDAVTVIINMDADLGDRIRQKENTERARVPRGIVLAGKAFHNIRSAITNYALAKILPEWAEAKAAAVTASEEEEEAGCSFSCENPQRYGLPCRHWMFKAAVTGKPIPQSLIHPRWFYDEPAVPRGSWCMTYSHTPATASLAPNSMMVIEEEDLYREHGAPMLESTLLGAQEVHRSLTGWEAEEFASATRRVIEQVVQLQEERRNRRSALPIEAPKNPAPTWERGGGKKREQAVTDVDLAEQQEREDSRQRRRQQHEARLEAESGQDQEVNFLNIDDFIKEIDMSQPNPASYSTCYATPERPEYSQIMRYATPDAPEYSQLTRFATPEALEYSQLTRYATPEAPEYSQLTQPLQLGSPSAPPPGMSSHASTVPRSYGHADPPPAKCPDIGGLLVVAAARAEREKGTRVVHEAARIVDRGCVRKAAAARAEREEDIGGLLTAAAARAEREECRRVVHEAATATTTVDGGCVREAAAAAKLKGRKARLRTEEEQKIDALKAEAKAANEEARVKKAAVKAATAAATAARKEAQRTAKELAAKKNKNKKESQPLVDQTQQADFELPFRSSQ
ncbi:MAG: hypothetical protein M1812_005206 [Candelaria pacifica]|nr:MAG: hypothetical protein M1812_005206 [Candelaria pacifica]